MTTTPPRDGAAENADSNLSESDSRRLMRIETRLCKFMEFFGLGPDGNVKRADIPVPPPTRYGDTK